ncbi:transcriptional regulator, BadM/Rrf2 family [Halobacillus karajensis]|uniref:HTH-type transcriptional regulator NsrR n=1 Tax=Halobacillus karajensis TaxID=195088 RepID=A0A059NZB9_9BACI|nr:Rrf2 family transcriptional regulator [Halobacillus karajensis]CDQ18421.1 HTH-type transcriptional repressor NsrR [Halobacillus karajensis]CDQ23507.1 HTH-type transcriptional repressor NsrR [Halobacillus karajensis]CDQ26989.1 HTH-type transcriptional repressor NsrR [Halobacillus karajensis]SEH51604.1 transcriptional regulator, BadM/Rrf2 family [Halobacillus karajensis]
MRLKKYTDYALRVLIFTASKQEGELANKKEISQVFHISENHLGKIIHELNKLELIETLRGRSGGIRLAKTPADINIGQVVRAMEDDFHLLECFHCATNYCVITPACRLKGVLHEALRAFLSVLDKYTLEDLLTNKQELRELMGLK